MIEALDYRVPQPSDRDDVGADAINSTNQSLALA